ncbi:unnamed protein product [Brachionus calyciflorus]|uniref:Serine aminopeptidase S33 domain-containing protein n=1 Tax=Brachionus calyciflorus TaxID=104777 RepID=A0A813PJV0_9BILA|nr:unnamed protein product [Brachionus calyciflorus]
MIENSLTGVWNGTIFVQSMPLMLLAHFFLNGDEIAGYLDIPMQNLSKIRIDIFEMKNQRIIFNATTIKLSFNGIEKNSKLNGIISRQFIDFPIEFEKIKNKTEYAVNRPQTPKRPFNYVDEQVVIRNNKANLILSEKFTYPKSQQPIASVVLCLGAGALDRDEEAFNHKPFMVIADFLTNNNIAVLRYDERGVRNSTGDFSSATDTDFADDAIAAIEYLKKRKETKNSHLRIIGHSNGTMKAMIASNNSKLVEFIVLLGSVGVNPGDVLYEQIKGILIAQNVSENILKINTDSLLRTIEIIKKEKDNRIVRQQVEEYFKDKIASVSDKDKKDFQNNMETSLLTLDDLTSPWFRSAFRFEPFDVLSKTKIPVLGIWGMKDLNAAPSQNLNPTRVALETAKNENFKLITFDGLNHLFQKSKTGLPNEYGLLEETFSTEVLHVINDWIHEINSYSKVNSTYDFLKFIFSKIFNFFLNLF